MIQANSIARRARANRRVKSLTKGRYRTAGFSLVELLVAVLIGLLVVAGLINLFVANKRAFQVQSGNNFLQENLRIASDRIGWSLRMAGFWGGNSASKVSVDASATSAVMAKGTCNGAWATAINPVSTGGGAVYGYAGATDFPIDVACIGNAANYVTGSDVLVVRYADSQALAPGPAEAGFAPAESATISDHPKQLFVLTTPAATAEIFAGTVPTTTTIKTHRYVYPFSIDVYYLRPCSVVPSGGKCTAAADDGLPLPTLMRMHLQTDGTFSSEPIVDGVEQVKFEYGVASDLSSPVPIYKSAAAVTLANQWPNVVSVRVALVAVSPVRDVKVPHAQTITVGTLAACTYSINNGSAATVTGCANFKPYGDKPWQFVRTKQEFVVQLRNQVRG
jgi:type IV pilus assembly protein PilW